MQKDQSNHIIVIAGTDSSGGSGLVMDIRVAQKYSVISLPIISCVTAQNGEKLKKLMWLDKDLFLTQLEGAKESRKKKPKAIKIGLFLDEELILTFVEFYEKYWQQVPLIVDPILSTGGGNNFISKNNNAVKTYFDYLLPLTTILKPNHSELLQLTQSRNEDLAVKKIINQGCKIVLLSGGHGMITATQKMINVVYFLDNKSSIIKKEIFQDYYKGNYRGTGCALSTSIACHIALEKTLVYSIESSLNFVNASVKSSLLKGDELINNYLYLVDVNKV